MITVLWPESALELARRGGEYKWCRTVIGKWVCPGKRKLSKLHSFLSLLRLLGSLGKDLEGSKSREQVVCL